MFGDPLHTSPCPPDVTDLLREQLQASLGNAYVLERELKGGGMSHVFVATESALDRRVVVKVLRPDIAIALSAERFAREIRLAARLQQANIVPVLAAATADGLPYYTMPFVEGDSLRARLTAGRMTPREAVGILRDIARALSYAHERGIVHRDVKPENVLLSGGAAMVTDFGIAKALRAARDDENGESDDAMSWAITQFGAALGTPAYMAPEQAVGDEVDARADVYAWGVMAYELLSGAHPFAAMRTTRELVTAHLMDEPSFLRVAQLPIALGALVMQCLAKDREQRPVDAGALIAALDASADAPAAASKLDASDVSRKRAPSIAVLPFENLSSDPENQYLADGLAGEITNALATLAGLRVVARTSAFAFRGMREDVRIVGEKLGVANVLEGSVRRAGNRIRVTAQLVDTADGSQLWSARYDRELTDIFAVQDEIATAIVGTLEITLVSRTVAMVVPPTNDIDAFRLYHKGLDHLRRRGGSIREAVACFEQAIARDDRFAEAHAALSEALSAAAFWGSARPLDVMERARWAATRAMTLKPDIAESHSAASYIAMWFDWDAAAASRAAARALELGPNETRVRGSHSLLVLCGARRAYDEAMVEAETILTNDPLSAYAWASSANLHACSHRALDEGLEKAKRGVEIDPASYFARMALANVSYEMGDLETALGSCIAALMVSGRSPQALSGYVNVHGRAGRPAYGDAVYDELTARARHEYVSSVDIAKAAHWAGRGEATFTHLEHAYEERDPRILEIAFEFGFGWDRLHDDARFRELRSRVGWNIDATGR